MRLRNAEAVHSALYGLHRDICRDALKNIRSALMDLHEEESHAYEDREEIRSWISELEAIRDSLDATWQKTAKLRSKIIQTTGCSGDCAGQIETACATATPC